MCFQKYVRGESSWDASVPAFAPVSVVGVTKLLNDIPRLACACLIVVYSFTIAITTDCVSTISTSCIVGTNLSRLVSLSDAPPIVVSAVS